MNSALHPMAWWVWALGLALATTRTEDPWSVALIVAAAVAVVFCCRDGSPWARAFPAYLVLGAVIVLIRVGFYVLVGIKTGAPVLLALPRIPLPDWAGGIQLLGPVSVPGLVDAAFTGVQLAALIICFGAANALANPKRALRSLPAALHQLGTAVVIAVTLAPQLVGSWRRVHRARSLRGHHRRGLRASLAPTIPVLQDALDRVLALAASMDSRGYARSAPGQNSRLVLPLLLLALLGAVLGTYALLDGTAPSWLGLPLLGGSAVTAVVGSIVASRRIRHTRYRPDPWRAPESLVAASGITVTVLVTVAAGLGTRPVAGAPVVGWLLPVLLAAIAAMPAALAPRTLTPRALTPLTPRAAR